MTYYWHRDFIEELKSIDRIHKTEFHRLYKNNREKFVSDVCELVFGDRDYTKNQQYYEGTGRQTGTHLTTGLSHLTWSEFILGIKYHETLTPKQIYDMMSIYDL